VGCVRLNVEQETAAVPKRSGVLKARPGVAKGEKKGNGEKFSTRELNTKLMGLHPILFRKGISQDGEWVLQGVLERGSGERRASGERLLGTGGRSERLGDLSNF